MDIAKLFLTYSEIIWSIGSNYSYTTNSDSIYLTIDDVINDDSFEEILDILDEFNINATFFIISSLVNDKNIHLLQRAIVNGHHLANHGKFNVAHALCSQDRILSEITHCEKLIENIYSMIKVSNPKIKYFRPGYGIVTNDISKICKTLGYKIVLGSIYPSDTKLPFPNLLSWYIRIKSKPNDIIILHDRKHNVSTFKKLIPHLKKKYIITCLPN